MLSAFLILATLNDVKWYFIMVLMYIFLMIKYVACFMC